MKPALKRSVLKYTYFVEADFFQEIQQRPCLLLMEVNLAYRRDFFKIRMIRSGKLIPFRRVSEYLHILI